MKLGTRDPNYPPSVPSDPTPIEGAYNLPGSSVTLEWECSDADNDSNLTYDVYLGMSDEPSLVMQDITIDSATFESLRPATTYSWKIIATWAGWKMRLIREIRYPTRNLTMIKRNVLLPGC